MITTSRFLVNPNTYPGKDIPDGTRKGSSFLRHTLAKYLVFFTEIGAGVNDPLQLLAYFTSPAVTRAPMISVATLFGTSA